MELSQNSIHISLAFIFKKGMTDRVQVKGNCTDSGPMQLNGIETLL